MKNLKDIIESHNFLINKKLQNRQDKYEYHPKTTSELQDIITDLLKKGITDLNCIDVSQITDMNSLFNIINFRCEVKNINISEWDVSNVTDMSYMFDHCKNFNSDLSKWDVSNVESMQCMFRECANFNSDLSKWNISNVQHMYKIFYGCSSLKLPQWYNDLIEKMK